MASQRLVSGGPHGILLGRFYHPMLTQFAADCCNQAIILMVAGHPLLRISPMALKKGF
jgi:hypothetical protein